MISVNIYSKNNKGFTLVELLVAIAIGGLVLAALSMLVSQGVNNYRKQTVLAALQNDANITLNQISDNVMEADRLILVNDSFGKTTYFQIKENVYYIYKDETIYQSTVADISKGSILCENVTEFDVRIIDTSLVTDKDSKMVEEINNPVQLRISLKVENMNEERAVNRSISMRNKLNDIGIMISDVETNPDRASSVIGISIDELSRYVIELR